jgi:hypothetical protein
MMGTLTNEKKGDWKSYVSSLVHAYNCTKHDSTGYSPFFLMFGRQPRLPIEVSLGVDPNGAADAKISENYVEQLRKRLNYAHELAAKNITKAGGRYKTNYDRRSHATKLEVGDKVLVRNVGFKGPHKLADRWEDVIYVVVEQPNLDVPVFVVQPEGLKGRKRTLHRNMLLLIDESDGEWVSPEIGSRPRPVPRKTKPPKPAPRSQRRHESRDEGVETDSSTDSEMEEWIFPRGGNPNTTGSVKLNPNAVEFRPEVQPVTDSTGAAETASPPVEVAGQERTVVEDRLSSTDAPEQEIATSVITPDASGNKLSLEEVSVVEEKTMESDMSELADMLEATLHIDEPPIPLPRRSTRERRRPDRYTPSRYAKIHQLMLLRDHFPYQRDLICGAIIELIKVS